MLGGLTLQILGMGLVSTTGETENVELLGEETA